MTDHLPRETTFSFAARPVPVPGELRIAWRLSLILLMLSESRNNRASLVKLHILNDAVRSQRSQEQLKRVLAHDLAPMFWRTRVEPAFARAIDFVVGEGLARWVDTGLGTGLQLTSEGLTAADQVKALPDALPAEKAYLADVGRALTEQFSKRLTSA